MADIVLLVFEGEKTEPQILENLRKHFFKDEKNTVIHATFNTHIYTLWDEVRNDEYLDLLEIIRERNERNRTELANIKRDDVSQIFLFFDYDGHVKEASDETIKEMLAHFNDETENGKLYISYPMVEALKHLGNGADFKDTVVDAKDKIVCQERQANYKQLVSNLTIYQNLTVLSKNHWHHIILENTKKANFIVNEIWDKPEYDEVITVLNQTNIFNHQLQKYIDSHKKVAVLSPFPLFIIEYFGELVLIELTENT
jgi:hypothetical protein